MSSDKRTVSTDALETLGFVIGEDAGRDAIHLAVDPATAAETLTPGQHVGFVDGGVGRCFAPVGIVDPFLTAPVRKGERFWLVVYPRQITSLRHVWSHPAFEEVAALPKDDKETSEAWMRAWAMRHMSENYYGASADDDRISAAGAYANAIEAGKNNNIGPYEEARDHIDDEWWGHWEAITGMKGDRDGHFSCSC